MQTECTEKGFTLIEILIAIMVFSIGILGAAKMQQHSMLTDIKIALYDEANRVLTTLSEDTNITELTDLKPPASDNQPNDIAALKNQIERDFQNNTALLFETRKGIRIYQLVYDFSAQEYKKVELCAAWKTSGAVKPHFLHRTIIKPTASDS